MDEKTVKNIAYFDVASGISGDMLLAALVDVGVPIEFLNKTLASLPFFSENQQQKISLKESEVQRGGFRAKKIDVLFPADKKSEQSEIKPSEIKQIEIKPPEFSDKSCPLSAPIKHSEHEYSEHIHPGHKHLEHEHSECIHPGHEHSGHIHRNLGDIQTLIAKSSLSERVQVKCLQVFQRLAEAEAQVHGVSVSEIHFHEVGAWDSIADIVGAVAGLDYLKIDCFYSSFVPTGSGTIHIQHGICPIPAPATAELLKNVPLAESSVPFELTTPTGAVLLTEYTNIFGARPPMKVEKIGVGAGTRNLSEQANVLRLYLGKSICPDRFYFSSGENSKSINFETLKPEISESKQLEQKRLEQGLSDQKLSEPKLSEQKPETEILWMLETNLDDMTGEAIGHLLEKLWEQNPCDVFLQTVQMKKNRPGIQISVLSRPEQRKELETCLFLESTTLGVRAYPVERTFLPRESALQSSKFGDLFGKKTKLPNGEERFKPEYDRLKQLAETEQIPFPDLQQKIFK